MVCDKFHLMPFDDFWEWCHNAGRTKNLLIRYTPAPHNDTLENRMLAYNQHVARIERDGNLCRAYFCAGSPIGYTFGRIN